MAVDPFVGDAMGGRVVVEDPADAKGQAEERVAGGAFPGVVTVDKGPIEGLAFGQKGLELVWPDRVAVGLEADATGPVIVLLPLVLEIHGDYQTAIIFFRKVQALVDVACGHAAVGPDLKNVASKGGRVTGEEGSFVMVNGTSLAVRGLGLEGACVVMVNARNFTKRMGPAQELCGRTASLKW